MQPFPASRANWASISLLASRLIGLFWRVLDLSFGAWGLKFWVWGLNSRVWGVGSTVVWWLRFRALGVGFIGVSDCKVEGVK